MGRICGVVIAIATAGVLAASARGLDTPTLPTVPVPTVPVPTVPTPTLPTVPAPVPPTPTVPTPPAPLPAPPKVVAPAPVPSPAPREPAPKPAPNPAPSPAPAPVPSSSSGSSSTPAPSYSVGAATHRQGAPAAGRHAARRPVVTTFHVRRRAHLRISVRELEPVCRSVGHYRLTAFPGLNRLRLPKHIGKTTLGVGTYALVGKTLLGRKVFDVVAAVHRKQGRLLARVRRTTTASCTETSTGVVAAASVIHTGTTSGTETTPSGKETKQSAAPGSVFTPPGVSAPRRHKSPLVRAATFDDAPPALRPLLYALLAISIGLLAAAAVPNTVLPAGATAAFLSSKRAYLAAAGIWLLVVVAVITAVA